MKVLWIRVFRCLNKIQLIYCRKTCWEKHLAIWWITSNVCFRRYLKICVFIWITMFYNLTQWTNYEIITGCAENNLKQPRFYFYKFFCWVFLVVYFTVSIVNNTESSQRTQTFLRRLQDVLKRSWRLTTNQDIVTTSGKRHRIYDVLKTSDLRCPEDVWFASSWRCQIWDVVKTPDLQRLQVVWFKTSWRRLIYDVQKTSVKWHLCNNVLAMFIQRQKKWLFLIFYCLKYSENFKFSSLG